MHCYAPELKKIMEEVPDSKCIVKIAALMS